MLNGDHIDLRHARDALFAIPPDCGREDWHRIGRAAIAAGLTVDDLDEWSRSAANYSGERDVRAAFRNITLTGGNGPGTLWKEALATGWRPPRGEDAPRTKALPVKARHEAATGPRGPSAAEVWARCQPAAAGHDYIVKKDGRPDGLRVVPAGDPLRIAGVSVAGWLVVPVLALSGGEPASLQFIPPPGAGKKLNLPRARMTGAFIVGELVPGGVAYIVEGIGQAWACWRATGHAAVVTFGVGRMRAVARELRQRDPAAWLVLVADAGQESRASAVAVEVAGAYVTMPEGSPPNFDACDLAQRDGAPTR